ncbi:tyrosine-type recombinase/integrase [Streptosporangium sp. NPDC050855]|uniref:tyrosine-type recombinase/integrase n=1 Tax=Streptosporangium sp. NPDC050855 TaxID=3366194 RepID=UPI0037B2BEE7
MDWLSRIVQSRYWRVAVATHRDPEGFATLEAAIGPGAHSSRRWTTALTQIATVLLAKGGGVGDIIVGDCLELREAEGRCRAKSDSGRAVFYTILRDLGMFPADAPPSLQYLETYAGQLSVEQLVDRHALQCTPVRDLLVDYLRERQPVLDYNSLRQIARTLSLHFWKDLELHQPGIKSIRLDREVASAWKERLRTKVTRRRQPDGSITELISPRHSAVDHLTTIRAFYLDIAQWATEDPARWGPWAVPSPITVAEISSKKRNSNRKARMDQRTRERLPVLPALVHAAHEQLRQARIRLDAFNAAGPGESFTVLGETLTKPKHSDSPDSFESGRAIDTTGRRRELGRAEQRAFWAWATVEFLRHTGARIEEMLETSHYSLTQYTLPDTGELIPLLHIAPSKTDEERLLVIDVELADVLAAVVARVRDSTGRIPLVTAWDLAEGVWNPPRPLLFQWKWGGVDRPVSNQTIRRSLNELLEATGLTDVTGQPLHYTPHDFRRLFTTEAILNGMPPHITQLILGHKDINTTMGYHTVYPQEVINGHRAFIARRRVLRPSEEYRTPTDEEWEEFLGHFQRRKLGLGECGRAYGTSCQHEHSCVRCPLLRVDPSEKARIAEIRDNMIDRIAEAEKHGWLGDVEQLGVTLAAANGKLAQLDERARRATTINLGMPSFPGIASRTITFPQQK